MLKFAANISMLFTEVDFKKRFQAAKDNHFDSVEFLFPYEYSISELQDLQQASEIEISLFNCPPGDWASGERGISIYPERKSEFQAGALRALDYAKALNVSKLHVMAGNVYELEKYELYRQCYLENLSWFAKEARKAGIVVLIEPLSRKTAPDYFLKYSEQAIEIIKELGFDNVQYQLDFFHMQLNEGNLAENLKLAFPYLGHIQIAGVPDRHEPTQGEVDYHYLFSLLETLQYDGYIGCEYIPLTTTKAGLDWYHPFI